MSWTGNKPKNRRERKNKKKRKKKRKRKKESVSKYVHKDVILSGTEMKRDGIKEKCTKDTFN